MTQSYSFIKTNFFVLIALVFFTNSVSAQTTTWDGSSWDAGTPDITLDAVFTGNYVSTANLATKSVLVSNNAQVTIASGHTLTVENIVDVVAGSNLILENNASLLQTNAAAVNSGSINYKRDAIPMRQFEYTYWSSPVTGQTLVGFSPLTSPDRYHSFDATTNNWVNESGSSAMVPGTGYAIRAPNTFNSTPQAFNGEFIGTPNNGDITANVVIHDPVLLNYNLIGNPYPSAISVVSLINGTTLGTLYFWTHNTAIANNQFSSNDYAIRTKFVGTQAVSGGTVPGAYVAAGQGFFASSSATGTITFTNSMRVANNNSQFYKSTQSPQTDPQYYYMWINMTNTGGAYKQLAIGYEEGATNGYDFGTDAAAAPGTFISFYSLIGSSGYAIQGRAFPWTLNDQIPLGYSTTIVGPFDITLDHYDTFFNPQAIYIQDIDLGVYHNLKNSPYNFNTAIGTFNNRFVIHYFDPNLSLEEYLANGNTVTITTNNSEIKAISSSENIKKIQIYDLLGKLIFEKEDINQNQYTIINLIAKNQGLIIKTQLENNQTVVKKLVY